MTTTPDTPSLPHHSGITGMVLTFNGARLLDRCLDSLAFCDALLVVDSFSTDDTRAIALARDARFVHHPFASSRLQLMYALSLVETQWVISLDQDEICSAPLRDDLMRAIRDANPDISGFYTTRRSWYYDRFMAHSGWRPDWLLRVFRRDRIVISQSGAHEHIAPLGTTGRLNADILHYPYTNFRHQLDKLNDYAQQGANDLARQGKTGGIGRGLAHGIWRFIRLYLLRKGFLDGRAGFLNAAHGAFYTFIKYVRVNEGSWGSPFDRS